MATIKQVAEEAGLSKSTVSRYISQKAMFLMKLEIRLRLPLTNYIIVPTSWPSL